MAQGFRFGGFLGATARRVDNAEGDAAFDGPGLKGVNGVPIG
ncbi:hypothetical protein ABZ532_28545 [Streptomyces sp. NPDC019396]